MKYIHKLKLSDKISILYKIFPVSKVNFTDYSENMAIEAMDDREAMARMLFIEV